MTVQMRHLLLTTALISVIAAVPLRAQTNTDAGNTAAATDAPLAVSARSEDEFVAAWQSMVGHPVATWVEVDAPTPVPEHA